MAESRYTVGRSIGFFEEVEEIENDDERDDIVVLGEEFGVYKVERVVELRVRKVIQI